jgi:ABC-type multidrug transport system fused ATPase/permease subunit
VPPSPQRDGRLAIYRRLLGAQVRGQASYRASFLLDLVGQLVAPIIDVLAILAVFRVARTLGGFHAPEVLVMFGISATAFALADTAVGNIEKLRDYVRRGLLDAVLVRPLSVLGQLLALDFTTRRMARILLGAGILVAVRPAGVTDPTGSRSRCWRRWRAVFFGAVHRGGHGRVLLIDWASSPTASRTAVATSPVPDKCHRMFRRLFAYSLGSASSPTPGAGAARPVRPARTAGVDRLGQSAGVPRGGAGGRPGMEVRRAPLPEHRLMTGASVIEARGLRKEFTVTTRAGRLRRVRRRIAAVDGVDLIVERGETLGYLGPNGAGKSTTLKMLTGVLMPRRHGTRADWSWSAAPPASHIGASSASSQLWWDLPLGT